MQPLDIKTFIGHRNIEHKNFIGYKETLDITTFT